MKAVQYLIIFLIGSVFNPAYAKVGDEALSPMWQPYTQFGDALMAVFAQSVSLQDGAHLINIQAPDIAENGAVVPVQVTSQLNAKKVAIFGNNQYYRALSVFDVLEDSVVFFSTRYGLGRTTTDVIVVIETVEGEFYVAQKEVRITIGSCGGGADPRAANTIGVAVGGAKDSDNFIENINRGFLPKLDSLTYEGVFYQHYFETGLKAPCDALFCPAFSRAISTDVYTDKPQHYLAVGLNSGLKKSDFKRKKLNLVVVLDISSSMGGRFNEYVYDQKRNALQEATRLTKMQLANQALQTLLEQLAADDRFGLVLFNERAQIKRALHPLNQSNLSELKTYISSIRETGGTDWSAGYRAGVGLFDSVEPDSRYENRIIFLTDAMPNNGELTSDGLLGMTQSASEQSIHTSFIGVGVDFNTDLVEHVSKIVGANYYSVHSSQDFQTRMRDEFDFMVSPLAYHLSLNLNSQGYKIARVFGTPEADISSGRLMRVNTLFPSASQSGKNKGGVILLQLQKTGHQTAEAEDIHLTVRYQDAAGQWHHNQQVVRFDQTHAFYDNKGIRKSILLANYVTLLKDWLLDSLAQCHDAMRYPQKNIEDVRGYSLSHSGEPNAYPATIKTWERRSCPLQISEGYQKLLSVFKRHYDKEMKLLNDPSLAEEQRVLVSLLMQAASSSTAKKPKSQPQSAYQTTQTVPYHALPHAQPKARMQAKSVNGIVTVKMRMTHPNTTLDFAKRTGQAFNFIGQVEVKVKQKTVCRFHTSPRLAKDPYFSCQFKDEGLQHGETVMLHYADLKNQYTLNSPLRLKK